MRAWAEADDFTSITLASQRLVEINVELRDENIRIELEKQAQAAELTRKENELTRLCAQLAQSQIDKLAIENRIQQEITARAQQAAALAEQTRIARVAEEQRVQEVAQVQQLQGGLANVTAAAAEAQRVADVANAAEIARIQREQQLRANEAAAANVALQVQATKVQVQLAAKITALAAAVGYIDNRGLAKAYKGPRQ